MATNLVYRNTDSKNRVQVLAATYGPGEPVISLDSLPAVTVTGSGDYTTSEASFYAPMTVSGIPAGGVGLVGKQVTLAFDGTWEFLGTGFASGNQPTITTITNGTAINFVTATGELTTAAVAAGIVAFGTVDFPPEYDKTRGYLPVKIGA